MLLLLLYRSTAARVWTHPSVARMQARASSLCANVMWALKFPGRGSDEFETEMAICAVDERKSRQGGHGAGGGATNNERSYQTVQKRLPVRCGILKYKRFLEDANHTRVGTS